MTFEEFQSLSREERLRVQLDELALVGAFQTGVTAPVSDEELSVDLNAALRESHVGNLMIAERVNSVLRIKVAHQISKETHVGESTVLKIIESYERTAVKAAG
ncbi:MAG: hypothetical protein L3J36_03340 [Rhodobacteraceae bacterium]|nr:hypothetical protein [Paracoccaceae bacterium]